MMRKPVALSLLLIVAIATAISAGAMALRGNSATQGSSAPYEATSLPTSAEELSRPGTERLGQLSPGQAAAVADSVITPDEYESSISDVLACLQGTGVTDQITAPTRGLDGVRLEYDFRTTTEDEFERASELFDNCYLQHGYIVDVLYQSSPEVEAAAEQNLAAVAACAGHSATVLPESVEVFEALAACAEQLNPTPPAATFSEELLKDLQGRGGLPSV